MTDGGLDARLDTVKKGYDQQQVKQLVTMLSAELKAIDGENALLRKELDLAKLNNSVTSSRATDDIISSWTRETNEMLEGARQHVSRIMEKANTDAAALVQHAETEAATTRRRAQIEADAILVEARAQAATVASESEQRNAAALLATEQRAIEIISAAEARAAETERAAQTSRASAQFGVDQLAAEKKLLREEVVELEHERHGIREQLINTQVYIQGLVALIDPAPPAARELPAAQDLATAREPA